MSEYRQVVEVATAMAVYMDDLVFGARQLAPGNEVSVACTFQDGYEMRVSVRGVPSGCGHSVYATLQDMAGNFISDVHGDDPCRKWEIEFAGRTYVMDVVFPPKARDLKSPMTFEDWKVLRGAGYPPQDMAQIRRAMSRGMRYDLDGRRISRKKAVELLGRKKWLFGVSRAAFHRTAAQGTNDGQAVCFTWTEWGR